MGQSFENWAPSETSSPPLVSQAGYEPELHLFAFKTVTTWVEDLVAI